MIRLCVNWPTPGNNKKLDLKTDLSQHLYKNDFHLFMVFANLRTYDTHLFMYPLADILSQMKHHWSSSTISEK